MCKYYGYIRVSTETQSEKGYGLDTQADKIRQYADQNAIHLEDIFTDAGISGNLGDTADDEAINERVGLIELLSVLEEGDTVIVLNTSRLWRSDMTKVLVRRELLRRNVVLKSIEQPTYDLYSKDPNDYLLNGIMELLDNYERMTISLKLARGRTAKAKTGNKPSGVCPFGYRYAEDKKSVIIDPDESKFVKLMYTEAQKGRTLQQICDTLNKQGSTTRRGKEWNKSSVRVILRNDFYIGVLHHRGQPIQGNHDPLISKIQFGKVNAQLNRRHQ